MSHPPGPASVKLPIGDGLSTITLTIPDEGRQSALAILDKSWPELAHMVRDALMILDDHWAAA